VRFSSFGYRLPFRVLDTEGDSVFLVRPLKLEYVGRSTTKVVRLKADTTLAGPAEAGHYEKADTT